MCFVREARGEGTMWHWWALCKGTTDVHRLCSLQHHQFPPGRSCSVLAIRIHPSFWLVSFTTYVFSVTIHRTTSGFDFQAFFPRFLAVCFGISLSLYMRKYLFMIRQSVSNFIAFICRPIWRVIIRNDRTFIYILQFMIHCQSIIRL